MLTNRRSAPHLLASPPLCRTSPHLAASRRCAGADEPLLHRHRKAGVLFDVRRLCVVGQVWQVVDGGLVLRVVPRGVRRRVRRNRVHGVELRACRVQRVVCKWWRPRSEHNRRRQRRGHAVGLCDYRRGATSHVIGRWLRTRCESAQRVRPTPFDASMTRPVRRMFAVVVLDGCDLDPCRCSDAPPRRYSSCSAAALRSRSGAERAAVAKNTTMSRSPPCRCRRRTTRRRTR